MEKTYAIIEEGKVTNVVVWDGEAEWEDSDKAVEVQGNAGIGWDYKDGKFTDNRPKAEEPTEI
jgi:hypothetical protein